MKRKMSTFAVMSAIMFLTMACSNEENIVPVDQHNATMVCTNRQLGDSWYKEWYFVHLSI